MAVVVARLIFFVCIDVIIATFYFVLHAQKSIFLPRVYNEKKRVI